MFLLQRGGIIMYKIFVVEDDEIVQKELCDLISCNGYDVAISKKLNNVVADLQQEKPHLILLDVNLPFKNGYDICSEWKNISSAPIIILTCNSNTSDEILSIKLGADDFITKPYNATVLLARIEALLKRTYGIESISKLEYDGITLDLSTNTLIYEQTELELTKNEFKILFILIKNKGKIITREELINYIWQSNDFIDENTLTVNINRVRKKLEQLNIPNFLKTKRGQGYIV